MISVAIDGPAGVGKSTVSKLLAKKLGWNYLDTGAFYRAITLYCQKKQVDYHNLAEIINALKCINIHIKHNKNTQHIFVNGEDVSAKIRTEEIDKTVAYYSQIKEVREKVMQIQRKIASEENIVIEGRDIGNNVLPKTKNKFFLTATAEERAKRRYMQRLDKNEKLNYDEILQDIKKRDEIDSTRIIAPLKPAKDAKIIDTTNLNIKQVVNLIYNLVKK